MFLYENLRKISKKLKQQRKERAGRILSPVRRIERVAPISGRRVCAMTFDDGPVNTPPVPAPQDNLDIALTKMLADILSEHGAGATFDIIGDTSENYPDIRGKADAFYWGGEKYDHYPDFEQDDQGGAKNCPHLVKYLLDGGFELSNHGYRHLIFGPSRVYSKREPFASFDEVVEDLTRLHTLIRGEYGYTMRLARPAHYIDGIRGGMTSYDAYEVMGYNYMAASADGGGWMPSSGNDDDDIRAMVKPLEDMLRADPESLNGQIIFQKDGCSMSRRTPVAYALEMQLKLLADYGYTVVSVGDLLSLSPFEDLSFGDECFSSAMELLEKGFTIGYKNNTLHPERELAFGEMCMMLCPRDFRLRRIEMRLNGEKKIGEFPLSDAYCAALAWADLHGMQAKSTSAVGTDDLAEALDAAGYSTDGIGRSKQTLTRREAICIIGNAAKTTD